MGGVLSEEIPTESWSIKQVSHADHWSTWLYLAERHCMMPGVSQVSECHDPNQIPHNYTVEVKNRFKGLDLIDGVPEELWTKVHDIVQEVMIKTIPMKKKCKMAKWLSEEALQIAEK